MPAPLRYYHDPGGRKMRARERRISELMEAARAEGGRPPDRSYWELLYDHELAPEITDHELLAATGFDVPPPDDLTDSALERKLQEYGSQKSIS